MTQRIRDIVVGASGRLVVGLCLGLFVSLSAGTAPAQSVGGAAELAHVPSNASIVAYANVREMMLSDVWARFRPFVADGLGQDQLEQQLGLNIERDFDHVLAFLAPGPTPGQSAGLALLRGRFDMTRLEAAAREGGATVSDYAGTRVVSIEEDDVGALAMAALEPGLVAVGDLATVHRAIDGLSADSNIRANEQMMGLLDRVESGSNAWAVGRFGDLSLLGILPDEVAAQMPAVTAFAFGGRVDGGVGGSLSIEGRDEEAGQNLRDVLRGVLALAEALTTGRPELETLVDSLQLSGTGTMATVSFWVPSEALDLLFSAVAP